MSQITTHILDTSLGKPARDVPIELFHLDQEQWQSIGKGHTNLDGRVGDLLPNEHILDSGTYRLRFDTESYYRSQSSNGDPFYPYVDIVFRVDGGGEHYHIPLLLNPFGYSTYRGS